MNANDLDRLRRWVGLPDGYTGFDPVATEGDCAMVEDKLLSEGWSVLASKTVGRFRYAVCSCTVRSGPDENEEHEEFMATAPSRREAVVLCALGVCL